MLDLKALEADDGAAIKRLQNRGEVPDLQNLLDLNKDRKAKIAELQVLQQKRNEESKALGKASDAEREAKRAALKELSNQIKEGEAELAATEGKIEGTALRIPNIPLADVPVGPDESANKEIRKVGTPRQFDFEPKDHVALGEALGIIDFERAAKISGSRFAFLRGAACQLNRALANFMADFHLERGDVEVTPPYLVRSEAMRGTGQLPKFEDDAFKIQDGDSEPYYLIPTAEVPVTNFHADEILDEAELPARFCAYSACFRAEAGAAGKDTRGLIRQHQFEKVEMVRFCTPEQAGAELDDMVNRASEILSALELPHRVVLLSTGDMGFSAEKTFDLEVWLPGQDTYREISSCSSCGTFQARRAKIRYRPASDGGKKAKPVPIVTLNGSGLAVGRTLIALLENHQEADGSIRIPEALRPYMRGRERIESAV
jgi:seryl-tRNA synthetase